MASTHTIAGLTRAIGSRAVHLRLVPRPDGISESREILRLLQGYGKVEMFKNLKYDALSTPNTMLAIFQSEEAAQQLLRRSPLRFNMSRDPIVEDNVESQDSQPTTDHSEPMSSDRMALAETAARQKSLSTQARSHPSPSSETSQASPPVQEYQLQVNIATMHHRDHINTNAYNGSFVVDSKSAVQEDLAKRVPLPGLSEVNLKKAEKPWRVLVWERERQRKQRKTLRQMLQEGNGDP